MLGTAPWRERLAVKAAVEGWVRNAIDRGRVCPDQLLVAVDERGTVVGFASVERRHHWSGEPEAHLGELVVAARAEGHGVGTALVQAAIERAETRDLPPSSKVPRDAQLADAASLHQPESSAITKTRKFCCSEARPDCCAMPNHAGRRVLSSPRSGRVGRMHCDSVGGWVRRPGTGPGQSRRVRGVIDLASSPEAAPAARRGFSRVAVRIRLASCPPRQDAGRGRSWRAAQS
jgi:GNAT superfamily N-acetyltransferase